MELRHVRYFLAVAEEKNFTRAALRVGIGQPPLSQQIRDLENELGTPLFRRVPQGAELTEAGQAFLPEARAIVAMAERAVRAAQRGSRGETGQLRVGFTGSAAFHPMVPAAVRAFKERYPEVELSLEEAHTTALLERLRAQDLDAIFIRPGRSDPVGMTTYTLAQEPMRIVLPENHPRALDEAVPLVALASEPLILFPRLAGFSLYDEIVAACHRVGFDPMVVQEAPQITSIGNLVAAGLGVSLVPACIAQIQVAGIRYVPIAGDAPVARLALATAAQEVPATARNFAELVLSNLSSSTTH